MLRRNWGDGGVAEWFKAAVLKTAVPETVPGVQIPPPPPLEAASRRFEPSVVGREAAEGRDKRRVRPPLILPPPPLERRAASAYRRVFWTASETAVTRRRGVNRTASARIQFPIPGITTRRPALHAPITGLGHGPRVFDERAAEEPRLEHARRLPELCPRRAGAERGHGHARARDFARDRLGKGQDIRLRRVVDGHERARLKRRRGRDVQDPPATARDHPGQHALRELRQRDEVHADHRELPVERRFRERPVDAESGVVDEQLDR